MTRRGLWPLAAIVLASVSGLAVWAIVGRDGSEDAAASSTATPAATATVSRRNLVQRETVSGTLGYADGRPLAAAAGGTVTRLRSEGQVVERGQALYWIDGTPVTLMYGATPAWRSLDASVEDGVDVRELEQNLVALGYDPDGEIEVDSEWGSATTDAVERWQADLDLEVDGAVELGEIVFLPGKRRIGSLDISLGAQLQPGVEVMETSGVKRVVDVDLEATLQTLVEEDDEVEVELPDGATLTGTIVRIGKVAETAVDAQSQASDPTIGLEIRLRGARQAGSLDQAPVDVSIARETRSSVLTVPVGALLALAEGGYAVEVVGEDGATGLVAVEPGLFADGLVEIEGEQVAEGMTVVVPS